MRAAGIVLACLLGLAVVVGGWLASRERIVLRTNLYAPQVNETALWAAREGLNLWVEAPSAEADWYRQLLDDPLVEVRERGRTLRFLAEPAPHAGAHLRRLRRSQHGWADVALSPLRDPERGVPVRLRRMPAGGHRA